MEASSLIPLGVLLRPGFRSGGRHTIATRLLARRFMCYQAQCRVMHFAQRKLWLSVHGVAGCSKNLRLCNQVVQAEPK
ncbi:hypothetical protein Plhal703r1_c37g0133821 [Plasmopara halstedii]